MACSDEPVLVTALRAAIAECAFTPAFQPVIHLPGGAIDGFEVLARWDDPKLGVIPPAVFIPLAEDLGLIAALTESIVSKACAAALQWDGDFSLALNLSPLLFRDGAVADLFDTVISGSGFPFNRLVIEITESAVFEDPKGVRATLDMLRTKGVRLSLDDFGTGFSSLTRLQALPFDQIKIDGSFVRTMVEDRDSRKIVSAVIGLGHSLGLSVVAECIETKGQAELLTQLGCGFAQGWLFGRPVPAWQVPALIVEQGLRSRMQHNLDLSTTQRLAQLQGVYNAAPVAMCFIDPRLRFLNANQRYAAMIGMPHEKIVGCDVADIVPWAVPHVQAAMDRAALRQPIDNLEHQVPGTDRFCRTIIEASRDETGDLLGISLAIIDVANLDRPTPRTRDGTARFVSINKANTPI